MVEALIAAILAGDRGGVIDGLHGRSEAERKQAAARIVPTEPFTSPHQHLSGTRTWDEQRERLANTAVLGTGTLKQVRAIGVPWVDEAAASAILLDRRPAWLASWAEWVLGFEDVSEGLWPVVRDLVRAGAIERPSTYIPGLLAMRWYHDDLGHRLDHDPEFFEQDVWDLIAYSGEAGSQRRSESGNKTPWVREIVARVEDRERLLDLTLERLNADLSAYRAAWYTKLWKALKVTREERAVRNDGLRSLLGAAAEPVIAFAVAELAKPGGTVTAADLAPALAASGKGTVRAALKLLPDSESALAAIALAHPDPEIQGEVLDRLERWDLDDAARAALLQHLDLLAATQRPRAEALLNIKVPGTFMLAPEVDLEAIPPHIRDALNFGGPLPPAPIPGEPVLGERLAPIDSFDELVATLRTVEWELDDRVLDAILRYCGEDYSGPEFEHALVHAWRHRTAVTGAGGLLGELEGRVVRREAGPLLSLPTHVGGWIAPLEFLERLHDHVGEHELAAALRRLAPDGREAALEAARELRGRHRGLIRSALGGGPVKHHRRPADPDMFSNAVRTGATEFPARRDLGLAQYFRAAAYGYADSELLELLVREGEPIAPLTLRYVVLALGAEDARAHLLAVDVLTAAIADGRIDALPTDDVADIKPNRLAARLTSVAEAGPLQRAIVRDFLDAAAERFPARSGPLLVLFDELCAQTGTGPRVARDHLATVKHKAARALLEREHTPSETEAQLALAARVRRAERWSKR